MADMANRSRWVKFSPWLDVLAMFSWGVLLLKYWITGQLNILIHPNYFALTVIGGIGLLVMAANQGYYLWKQADLNPEKRLTVLPQDLFSGSVSPTIWNWGTFLLIGVAVVGLITSPRPFTSQTALQRGITEGIPMTRIQPQQFRTATKPEDRSLVEWIRTLNVYPEPDAYTGQKAQVQGFVMYPPSLPDGYLWVARFILTCCAADAYPIGLPVKLTQGNRSDFPADTWVDISGNMITETFEGQRHLTIRATEIKRIPEPKNPYDY